MIISSRQGYNQLVLILISMDIKGAGGGPPTNYFFIVDHDRGQLEDCYAFDRSKKNPTIARIVDCEN